MCSLPKEEIAGVLGKKEWSEENFFIDKNSIAIKNLKLKAFSIRKIQDKLKEYGIQKLRFELCSFCDSIKVNEQDRVEDTLFNEVDFKIFLSIEFYECIFKRSIKLSGIYFEQGLGFYCSEFKDRVNFGKSIFAESLILFDTIANHHISFLETSFIAEVDIENCYFDRNLNFSNSSFSTLYSRHSYFKEVDFSNTIFRGSVLFKNCQFEKKLLLENNNFRDDYNVCFIGCVFNEYIVLDTESEEKICSIHKSKHNNIAEKAINEYFDFGTENCYRLQRDFFRRMKNNRLKDNDVIGASYFKVHELEMREKELGERNNLGAWVEKRFLEFFRSISNHHTDFMSIIYSFSYVLVLFACFAFVCLYLNGISNCLLRKCCHGIDYKIDKDTLINALILFVYIIFNYIALVYLKKNQFINKIVLIISIFLICKSPALLFPLSLGIFKKQCISNLLSNLYVFYAIILGVIIWSLIRTGQKNTKLL